MSLVYKIKNDKRKPARPKQCRDGRTTVFCPLIVDWRRTEADKDQIRKLEKAAWEGVAQPQRRRQRRHSKHYQYAIRFYIASTYIRTQHAARL